MTAIDARSLRRRPRRCRRRSRPSRYAFLSHCHTGALLAPDGPVDWLCVPAFDSPASSAACWTARAACSGSARTPSRTRPRLAHSVSERGVPRQHYGTDSLDASTLLAVPFGFLPPDDERMRNTVEAIADDLTEHGYVLRYRTDQTDDGMSGKEGTPQALSHLALIEAAGRIILAELLHEL